jgi:hypothetical protein
VIEAMFVISLLVFVCLLMVLIAGESSR